MLMPVGAPLSLIPALPLNSTLGAAFIGYSFALVLYGVTCLQTITYYQRCKQDSLILKSIIMILWILDCLHTILISHGTYRLLISTRAGPPQDLIKPPWSYCVQVFITVISNLLVRTVYSSRIYRLSHGNIIIPIAVIVLSFYVLATGIVFGTEALRSASWSDLRHFSWSMYSGYGAEMAADSTIALCMSILLVRMRTGLRSSDTLVQTLVVYSINTGLLTTICVFVSLITFITLPNSLAFLASYFILSKLYVNSLLGTLNARSKIRLLSPSSLEHAKGTSNTSGPMTDSSAYTTQPATGILTTAITLGTVDVDDIESGSASEAYEMKPETQEIELVPDEVKVKGAVSPHIRFDETTGG